MSSYYYAEVEKTPNTNRGTLSLYKDDDILEEWEVVTGGKILDPYKYGGTTPPIEWVMVEKIERRRHPNSGTVWVFGRIVPAEDEYRKMFRKRSFGLENWPFMIHAAGRSTGCIAIKGDFLGAVKALNQAYEEMKSQEESFIIDVYDAP